jgi:hypothetical protein
MQRPVESAAAVEIGFGGLRRLLLNDSHSCLESTKRFPHFPQGPTTLDRLGNPEDQKVLAGTDFVGVDTLVPNTCTMAGFELITVGRFWGDN